MLSGPALVPLPPKPPLSRPGGGSTGCGGVAQAGWQLPPSTHISAGVQKGLHHDDIAAVYRLRRHRRASRPWSHHLCCCTCESSGFAGMSVKLFLALAAKAERRRALDVCGYLLCGAPWWMSYLHKRRGQRRGISAPVDETEVTSRYSACRASATGRLAACAPAEQGQSGWLRRSLRPCQQEAREAAAVPAAAVPASPQQGLRAGISH